MAGHTQWAKSKRRKIFAGFARAITVAAKMGWGEPSMEDFKIDKEGFEILTEPANLEPAYKNWRAPASMRMPLPRPIIWPMLWRNTDVMENFSTAEFLAASA